MKSFANHKTKWVRCIFFTLEFWLEMPVMWFHMICDGYGQRLFMFEHWNNLYCMYWAGIEGAFVIKLSNPTQEKANG